MYLMHDEALPRLKKINKKMGASQPRYMHLIHTHHVKFSDPTHTHTHYARVHACIARLVIQV